jgi:Na+/melibiose symporter-like transporter
VPAERSIVPSLVPAGDLLAANALAGQNRDLARLLGSSLGGVLAAWGGVRAVAAFDGATFLVAAVLVAMVRPARSVEEVADGDAAPVERVVRRLLREWRDGLRVVGESRGLRTVLAFVLVASVGEGIMGTLMAPWVRDVVHGDGRAYGLIMAVQAVGGIAGGLVAATFAGRASPRALFAWGAVAFGLLDCALFTYPLLWPRVGPALVIMVAVGVPGALTVAGRLTVVQTLVEDRFRGRVFGALGAVQGVSALVGIGTASWLGEAIGILPVIVLQGVGYVLGGVVVLVGLPDHS